MNKNSFTLIEVLVSVVLVFIIGLTLTQVSSQNTNTLVSVKEDYTFLDSAVLNSTHEYRDINDYITLENVPNYDYIIEKKEDILSETVLPINEVFSLNYILKKQKIISNDNEKAYFRIQ